MKCPQCQHDMVQGTNAWICVNCGHHIPLSEASAQTAPAPTPAPTAAPQTAPESAPVAAQPSVVQPTATPALAPSTPIPGTLEAVQAAGMGPKPKKPGMLKWIIIAVVAVLALGGVSYAYYYQTQVRPKTALADYVQKVATVKSESFKSTAILQSDKVEEGSGTNATFAGAYDGSKAGDEKISGHLDLKFGSMNLVADLAATQQALFFKVTDPSVLQMFGFTVKPDWYKMDVKDVDKNKCQDSYNPANVFKQFGLNDIPVKDTKLKKWSETVDGHGTTHYTGNVDFDKLQAAIDKANTKLSDDCKITMKASDFKDIILSYDVWSGSDFDKVRFNYNDTKNKYRIELSLETSDYNKPGKVEIPSNAKSMDQFAQDVVAAGNAPTDNSGSGSSNNAKLRDSQRKSDIRNIKTALETYYNDKNGYPSAKTWEKDLTGDYIKTIPKDPKTGASYMYMPMPTGCKSMECTSYTLMATLENTKDGDIKSGTTNTYEVESAN